MWSGATRGQGDHARSVAVGPEDVPRDGSVAVQGAPRAGVGHALLDASTARPATRLHAERTGAAGPRGLPDACGQRQATPQASGDPACGGTAREAHAPLWVCAADTPGA
jgi:hypothetical protein